MHAFLVRQEGCRLCSWESLLVSIFEQSVKAALSPLDFCVGPTPCVTVSFYKMWPNNGITAWHSSCTTLGVVWYLFEYYWLICVVHLIAGRI